MDGFGSRLSRRFAMIVAAGGMAALLGAGDMSRPGSSYGLSASSLAKAIRVAEAGSAVEAFYVERGHRPIWIESGRASPAAARAVLEMTRAERHGLDSNDYLTPDLRRRLDDPTSRPEMLEADLSLAFVRFVRDVRQPSAENDLLRVDEALPVPFAAPDAGLRQVAEDGTSGVSDALAMHPDYDRLAAALQRWRTDWRHLPEITVAGGPVVAIGARDARLAPLRRRLGLDVAAASGPFDAALAERLSAFQRWHGLEINGALDRDTVQALNADRGEYEARILTNLDRLRALPADPGRRHILVNVPEARLTAHEAGRVVNRMKVVVGGPRTPTPMMAGRIRHAVLSPYWNIPQDLVRDQIAPAVLRGGVEAFDRRGLEALTGWSPQARDMDPSAADWTAVASGQTRLRVRQKPGPGNMMGEVKFMLPNDLGIYLHDTPDRDLFARGDRALSAGCVRVEDAQALGRWLLRGDLAGIRTGAPEQTVDLATPVPVYILYQTVAARPGGGLTVWPDVYGWDRAGATASA